MSVYLQERTKDLSLYRRGNLAIVEMAEGENAETEVFMRLSAYELRVLAAGALGLADELEKNK